MEIKNLEVLVMPNGEVIFLGKTIGFVDTIGKFLSTRPKSIIVPITYSDREEMMSPSFEGFDWTIDGIKVKIINSEQE